MNLDDKNIDQILRDSAQNAPAPNYDSSYWNEVSSILDAESKKKKFLLFWSLGGSLVVVLLFSILLLKSGYVENSILYSQVDSENLSAIRYSESPSELTAVSSSQYKSSYSGHNSSRSFKGKINSLDHEITKGIDTESNLYSLPIKSSQSNSKEGTFEINNNLTNTEKVSVSSEVNSTQKNLFNEIMPSLAIKKLEFDNGFEPSLINLEDKRTWNLAIELDAGIMENYKTSRPFESGLFNLAFKAFYNKSNLILSSGLGLQVSTNSDLVVSQRAKFYGFGVVNYQTDLSYQNMYDIYIPVEIGYKHGKTSFGMGLQANYLINTTMLMQKYEDLELISSENISGFSNGLNKFSTQGYVWMSHQIGDHFSAGFKLGTSFSNRIKEGDYFNESATTNPVFGQVSLRYNIFK